MEFQGVYLRSKQKISCRCICKATILSLRSIKTTRESQNVSSILGNNNLKSQQTSSDVKIHILGHQNKIFSGWTYLGACTGLSKNIVQPFLANNSKTVHFRLYVSSKVIYKHAYSGPVEVIFNLLGHTYGQYLLYTGSATSRAHISQLIVTF